MPPAASRIVLIGLRCLAAIGLALLVVGAALTALSRFELPEFLSTILAALAPWVLDIRLPPALVAQAPLLVGLGLLLLTIVVIGLFLTGNRRMAWPEIWIGLFLFAAVLLPSLPSTGPTPSTSLYQLRIKVSDLDSGASRLHRDRLVTLVVLEETDEEPKKTGEEPKKTVKATCFYDLKILDLLNANRIPVSLSEAAPDSILFDVPATRFLELSNTWGNPKKGAYLLPQAGPITPTPTATTGPTPTVGAGTPAAISC